MRARVFVVCAVLACTVVAIRAQETKQDTKKAPASAAAKSKGAPATKGASPADAALIKKAEAGGPAAIAKSATIAAPSDDMKTMRTLRNGTNGYTCMSVGPDPMCADQNAMEWFNALMSKKDPPAGKIGFVYMLMGDHGASNTDPFAEKETPTNNWVVTGPHVMVLGSKGLAAGYPHDAKADPTKAYVMWSGTPYEHLMLPVK
jgi:hypothetical protein